MSQCECWVASSLLNHGASPQFPGTSVGPQDGGRLGSWTVFQPHPGPLTQNMVPAPTFPAADQIQCRQTAKPLLLTSRSSLPETPVCSITSSPWPHCPGQGQDQGHCVLQTCDFPTPANQVLTFLLFSRDLLLRSTHRPQHHSVHTALRCLSLLDCEQPEQTSVPTPDTAPPPDTRTHSISVSGDRLRAPCSQEPQGSPVKLPCRGQGPLLGGHLAGGDQSQT